MKPVVLLVDDEIELVERLGRYLGQIMDVRILMAFNGYHALDMLKRHCVDAIVLDVAMPGISGRDVAIQARQINPDMGIVVVTGWECRCLAEILTEINADYLVKPVGPRVICEKIKRFLGMMSCSGG